MSLLLSAFLSLAWLGLSSAICRNYPIQLQGVLLEANENLCPASGDMESVLEDLNMKLDEIIENEYPQFSTLANPPECPGTGWIKLVNQSYGDSETMCPEPWVKETENNVTFCRTFDDSPGCHSVYFGNNNTRFSQVCGRVRGYQRGPTVAFLNEEHGINNAYLDGVSITHGAPDREHIWSFAAGAGIALEQRRWMCPCINNTQRDVINTTHGFINENYFCNAATEPEAEVRTFYPEPLWDGAECLERDGCCSRGSYFVTTLSESACDRLEVRICRSIEAIKVDIVVDLIELYVK